MFIRSMIRTNLIVLLGLVAIATGTITASAESAGLISPDMAAALSAEKQLKIIDVRSPPEWAWTGVAKGAARANWWQPGDKGFLNDVLQAVGGDRTRPIALICARGVRSSKARRFLLARGFTDVRDIGEGMLGSRTGPGWLARKLPLEK